MDALGCPDGGSAVPVRATSSTAQQALAMLNDAFLIRRAERLAERIVSENTRADAAAQVRAAFGIVLQREPAGSETRSFHDHVSQHGLANACHLLLNSNEFLFLD